jgi:F420-non-reducing hydrogenase iron-sulfur subunit
MEAIQTALAITGIDARRVAIAWSSSAEAPRFAHLVTAFTQTIREIGPNPLHRGGKAGGI